MQHIVKYDFQNLHHYQKSKLLPFFVDEVVPKEAAASSPDIELAEDALEALEPAAASALSTAAAVVRGCFNCIIIYPNK